MSKTRNEAKEEQMNMVVKALQEGTDENRIIDYLVDVYKSQRWLNPDEMARETVLTASTRM